LHATIYSGSKSEIRQHGQIIQKRTHRRHSAVKTGGGDHGNRGIAYRGHGLAAPVCAGDGEHQGFRGVRPGAVQHLRACLARERMTWPMKQHSHYVISYNVQARLRYINKFAASAETEMTKKTILRTKLLSALVLLS